MENQGFRLEKLYAMDIDQLFKKRLDRRKRFVRRKRLDRRIVFNCKILFNSKKIFRLMAGGRPH